MGALVSKESEKIYIKLNSLYSLDVRQMRSLFLNLKDIYYRLRNRVFVVKRSASGSLMAETLIEHAEDSCEVDFVGLREVGSRL